MQEFFCPPKSGPHRPGMKRPVICRECRGWFEGNAECRHCSFLAREVVVSWNYWIWAIMGQVHNLLQASFRERRGVVKLLAVPPAVGFALLDFFAWPQRGKNAAGPYYTPAHPSWKQGTSKNKAWHFIKFAYDCMEHATWAFPLENYFWKEAIGAVRLASGRRHQDPRLFGTPVQFKYKFAVPSSPGVPVAGVHMFTISANITHVGRQDGHPRFNYEYGRWVPELQQEHLLAIKRAVHAFPSRPFRSTHKLNGVVHPLAGWALDPTPLPHVKAAHTWGGPVSDDELDEDDLDELNDESSADESAAEASAEASGSVDDMTCAAHFNSYS